MTFQTNSFFGLKCRLDGHETLLMQTAGGNVRLGQTKGRDLLTWWSKPPKVVWEIYETPLFGQAYDNQQQAQTAADELTKLGRS